MQNIAELFNLIQSERANFCGVGCRHDGQRGSVVRADTGLIRLFAAPGRTAAGSTSPLGGLKIASLLNEQAASRLGVVKGKLPGSYEGVYASRERTVEEHVYEKHDIVRVDPVYEERAVTETQDVYEQRAVTETRNVYETRAVYEDRAIMGTQVTGTRSLSAFRSASQANIDTGADFSINVGNDPLAVVRFESGSRIAVTVGGSTQRYSYTSADGSFTGALVSALDGIASLSASLTADGKLFLETGNAQSLTIADVANGFLDFSRSPLASLGLAAGTTNASVVGHEQVQTGTEQVLVGTETVTVGTQQVLVGQQTVVTGHEHVQVGETSSVVGTEMRHAGTAKRALEAEMQLVGLKDNGNLGVGRLNLLDGFDLSNLASNPVLALFRRDEPTDAPRSKDKLWPDAAAGYAEVGASDKPARSSKTEAK